MVILACISLVSTGVSSHHRGQYEAEATIDDSTALNQEVSKEDFTTTNLARKKRSLGLFASVFNRMMFNMVQDSMEHDNDSSNNIVDDNDVIKLVRCDLVLKRKVCTIKETEKQCQNYYDKQCFMYKYPKIVSTVEEIK